MRVVGRAARRWLGGLGHRAHPDQHLRKLTQTVSLHAHRRMRYPDVTADSAGRAAVGRTGASTRVLSMLASGMTADALLSPPDSSLVADEGVPPALVGLLNRLAAAPAFDPSASALADQAVAVLRRPGFDALLSLPQLTFEPFDYQRETASTVLRRMRGRAILADEVGLGKTIEAGLILAELRLRGLAERSLVLTPAGLVEQWRDELERKFSLPTAIVTGRSGIPDCRGGGPVALASLAAARREPLKGELTRGGWDLVVADEAHRLRSAHSASGKLIRTLTARFLLLLTATPVENRLRDLYEMISLVAPGLLGTPAQFRSRYGGGGDDVTSPRNLDELRTRTRQVMVRHRRSE